MWDTIWCVELLQRNTKSWVECLFVCSRILYIFQVDKPLDTQTRAMKAEATFCFAKYSMQDSEINKQPLSEWACEKSEEYVSWSSKSMSYYFDSGGSPRCILELKARTKVYLLMAFLSSRYMYQPMLSSAAAANSILHSCLCLCMPSCISKDLCQASSVLIILIYPRSRTSTTTTVADFQLPCVRSFMLFQYPQTTQARVTQNQVEFYVIFVVALVGVGCDAFFFCFFSFFHIICFFFHLMAHETKRREMRKYIKRKTPIKNHTSHRVATSKGTARCIKSSAHKLASAAAAVRAVCARLTEKLKWEKDEYLESQKLWEERKDDKTGAWRKFMSKRKWMNNSTTSICRWVFEVASSLSSSYRRAHRLLS